MNNLIVDINSELNNSLKNGQLFFDGSLIKESLILQLTEKLISSLQVNCPYKIEINNFYFSRHLDIKFQTGKRTFIHVKDVKEQDPGFIPNKIQLKIIAPGFYVYISNTNMYVDFMTKIIKSIL